MFHGTPREHGETRLTAIGVHAYALRARAQRSKRSAFLHSLIALKLTAVSLHLSRAAQTVPLEGRSGAAASSNDE